MDGVSLKTIVITAADKESTKLSVQLEIMCESEFEAIGWLISRLDESNG